MPDEIKAAPPSPVTAHLYALHTYLLLLGGILTVVAVSGIIPNGPWDKLVMGLASLFSTGGGLSGVVWQSPNVRARLQEQNPTPVPVAEVAP